MQRRTGIRIGRMLLTGSLWLPACSPPPQAAQEPAVPAQVTFSEHVAPLLHRSCVPCHRPGGAGPFPLITYRDAAKRAQTLAEATASRFMPPWPADPSYRHFVGERVLEAHEIELLSRWAAQGAPLGDSSRIPAPPAFAGASGLGKPDLVIRMPEAVPIAGNNRDRFLFLRIPFELPQDTFVRAIEFVPGNRRLVHHVNGHLVSFAPGAKQNVFQGEYYVDREQTAVQDAYPRMGLLNDDGTYPELTPLICNYLPGVTPMLYPEGIGGFRIRRQGALLLNDLHYGPSPLDTSDQSHFNLYFAAGPPRRPTREIQLGTLGISAIVPPLVIPPDTVMEFRTRAVIQQDISLLTLNPHMHLLGKSFLAYAVVPAGDTVPLIRIPAWDFRWQYFYTFETMLHLPAGTLIEAIGVFDNTRSNPNNPFDPPRTVSEREGSMRTTDEMLQFILTYLPYQPGDEQITLGSRKP
ncbi:MAG: hypothetical protein NW241_09975 [Bacteroidia bacterium]|nr:hypothetical protein [Bacteroidia bacterium]